MTDSLEPAIRRVQKAMDRVIAIWDAEHPEQPVHRAQEPSPAAWHPDPDQPPAATRQWAEVTRLRAISLREHGRQIREEAALVGQATRELHRPSEDQDPGYFTRVSPAILAPPPAPTGTLNASR